MKFSVIVCTYNSSEKSVVYTLDSIINQDFEDFEVIICDDGSIDNKSVFYETYFNKKSFEKYKLVMNVENKGTVRNLISGLKCANGEYIKAIGAGDALSDKDVLNNTYCYMKKNNSKLLFSDMNVFTIHNDERIIIKKNIPVSKKKYEKGNSSKCMKKNIIVLNDQISGASMFFEKQKMLEYFENIKDVVIYMEDLVQYLFLLDGIDVHYFNRKCVNYEIGEGISTKKDSKNNIRMKKDKESFLNYMFNKYSDDLYVKRRIKLEKIEQECENKLLKSLKKICAEPKWAYYRIKRRG